MSEELLLFDNGRVLRENSEEITAWRWARKRFPLPSGTISATIWALLHEYDGNSEPLIVEINGVPHRIEPTGGSRSMLFRSIPLRRECLSGAELQCIFKVDGRPMPSWSLAICGEPQGRSALSVDQGRTWGQRLGLYGYGEGEYVVRVVCETPQASAPRPVPAFVWEALDHPRLGELRQLLDEHGAPPAGRDEWESQQALRTWVAGLWPYAHSGDAAAYAPWDPWFLLDWTSRKSGQGRPGGVISMCVHYGVFYMLACLARGWPARCIILTSDLGGMFGHFVTEVWSRRWGQWVLMDPNGDLHFERNGRPLGVLEVHDSLLGEPPVTVPGHGYERLAPRVRAMIDDMLPKRAYRNAGLWPRNDFLSRPDLVPAQHGSTSYCEPEIVWWRDEQTNLPGIFPCFTSDRTAFTAPPPGIH